MTIRSSRPLCFACMLCSAVHARSTRMQLAYLQEESIQYQHVDGLGLEQLHATIGDAVGVG